MIIAYFIGSIPSGLWIGRYFRDLDIREYGSGNLGATNAFRVLGKKLGLVVLFCDVLKGLIPVVALPVMLHITPTVGVQLLIGASAIVGHVLSCFVRFKGGKGVATTLGVFLAIAPGEMLIVLVIGIILIAVWGYVSLAAVTGAVVLPFLMYLSGRPFSMLLVASIICGIVIIRHKGNIIRLLQGRENRFYDTSGDDEEELKQSTASYDYEEND
jgi:glycerol-3-phosphate acyltransferase PlsY